MPIFIQENTGKQRVEHHGEVVQIRKYQAQRNLSDTLDYTDFQTVNVTEALVYVGRTRPNHNGDAVPLDAEERFRWTDCSNLFVWRGSDHRTPVGDELRHPDVVIDLCEYVEAQRELAARAAADAVRVAAKVKAVEEEREKNRPVTGKKMEVYKGRKVARGTVGIVAFVHSNGGVLLKPEAVWKDRNAQGTWVNASNLRAVE